MTVARREARATAARIREHRQLLDQWRSGAVDGEREADRWKFGQVLDGVETSGDVPPSSAATATATCPTIWPGAGRSAI
jgi:hypothetical protein